MPNQAEKTKRSNSKSLALDALETDFVIEFCILLVFCIRLWKILKRMQGVCLSGFHLFGLSSCVAEDVPNGKFGEAEAVHGEEHVRGWLRIGSPDQLKEMSTVLDRHPGHHMGKHRISFPRRVGQQGPFHVSTRLSGFSLTMHFVKLNAFSKKGVRL